MGVLRWEGTTAKRQPPAYVCSCCMCANYLVTDRLRGLTGHCCLADAIHKRFTPPPRRWTGLRWGSRSDSSFGAKPSGKTRGLIFHSSGNDNDDRQSMNTGRKFATLFHSFECWLFIKVREGDFSVGLVHSSKLENDTTKVEKWLITPTCWHCLDYCNSSTVYSSNIIPMDSDAENHYATRYISKASKVLVQAYIILT